MNFSGRSTDPRLDADRFLLMSDSTWLPVGEFLPDEQTSQNPLVFMPSTLDRILASGIVAVIRAENGDLLVDVAQALLAGGVDAIEVTFTVPRAHQVLEQVANRLGGKVVLGAGTVLDAETTRIAILSGADFVVSPAFRPEVIQTCKRYSKVVMPGALTPTEVIAAWEAGADVVKVFPSEITGPQYLKALHGPFPQVRLMPTGGVNLETAAEFLKCGACALGVGSSLVSAALMKAKDWTKLESLAKQYVQIVQDVRTI